MNGAEKIAEIKNIEREIRRLINEKKNIDGIISTLLDKFNKIEEEIANIDTEEENEEEIVTHALCRDCEYYGVVMAILSCRHSDNVVQFGNNGWFIVPPSFGCVRGVKKYKI